MLENILAIGQQVGVLFILIGIGVICGKTKFLSDAAITGMTDFVLYIVTPCIMISSFQRDFNPAMASGFFATMLFSAATILVAWAIGRLTLHDADKHRESVYRFSVIFSNCGFMALPLESALLGPEGLFFGAAFLVAFNVALWTLGLYLMSHNKQLLSFKKLLLNPGIIGVAIGLVLFFTSTTLPPLLSAPVEYLSALNTPLPMIVIGYHLSHAKLNVIFRDLRAWLTIAERLIAVPLAGLAISLIIPLEPTAYAACMIAVCTPVAANSTMFAILFGQDSELSVGLVSMSTILSIFTMPAFILLSQMIQ